MENIKNKIRIPFLSKSFEELTPKLEKFGIAPSDMDIWDKISICSFNIRDQLSEKITNWIYYPL